MILTVAEISAAVRGEIRGPAAAGDIRISGVTQDSREIEPGMLFVPIIADRDGHEFIPAAAVPLGGPLTEKLTDPVTGLVLDAWINADGVAEGNATNYVSGP